MAKMILNFEGLEGVKLKRSVEAFSMERGQTLEETMLPFLRGISQQVGVNANDDEVDQEDALARAEKRGAKAKAGRDARAAETARLQANSDPHAETAKQGDVP